MAAYYTFEDYSGTSTPVTGDNPYQDLIAACNDDPSQIQSRYNTHRTNRNTQQRAKLLTPDFSGVTIDEILAKLEHSSDSFVDPRHCLVFWARPPTHLKTLISNIQQRLRDVAPNLWIMPPENLHMTAMEVTHSLAAPEIEGLVETLRPNIQSIADYAFTRRARLVKPLLSFDAQALALSFLPAAGEASRSTEEDQYTYHHLRRDLHNLITTSGVKVASRYVVPSAHLTIARFITKKDFQTGEGEVDLEKVAKLVDVIEELNAWLRTEYWPEGRRFKDGGEWIVGEEKGLECRKGTLWYGGGERIYLGKGF
ncbi:uncharacterized protein LTR77_006304 [Saxophila tyrrhenica]|uniref:RNA ligase/cyclic nucleotide phosphodiesterase n=1 Tax=Saxophila tyrrhenica TaxID=1690608 RepID=A0AAV9PBQ3_9PEZI|nr:hypothetical protein LTR77_006304 [Saxophila tyrrhenica]